MQRGSELLKAGKLGDAQKVFRAALALDDGNPRVLALLGLAYFRGGEFAAAQPIYEKLVERAPTDASHRLNLGLVYLKLGDAEKAIAALEESRALDPSQGRAVSYLGLAYARAGRYAEAYRAFLLAGQNDLASEIEINLTAAERESIHQQLQRSGIDAKPEPRTKPPSAPPKKAAIAEAPPPPKPEPAPAPAKPALRPDDVPTQPVKPLAKPPEPPPPPPPAPPPVAPTPPPPPAPSPLLVSAPAIIIDKPPEPSAPAVPSNDTEAEPGGLRLPGGIEAPRMTDSLQFVMPTAVVTKPVAGQSMISAAVAQASPSQAAAAGAATRPAAGAAPPIPLSQLATDELVRPEDNDHPFEVAASGALIVRITDRVLTRLDGVHVSGGDLAYEPSTRRSRGHQTDDKFDYGGAQLHVVSGRGYLIALPGERVFTAVSLDDDIFYLREDLVFAFEASLRWENGNVPGLRGRFPVVQFRGDGAVALRSKKPLVRVKLPAQGVLFIDVTRLAGWIGRVIPRAVVPPVGGPMGEVCVECTGEGVVLIDPIGDPSILASEVRRRPTNPPPPPGASAPQREASVADLLGDDDLRDEF